MLTMIDKLKAGDKIKLIYNDKVYANILYISENKVIVKAGSICNIELSQKLGDKGSLYREMVATKSYLEFQENQGIDQLVFKVDYNYESIDDALKILWPDQSWDKFIQIETAELNNNLKEPVENCNNTEATEDTEDTEDTESTEATEDAEDAEDAESLAEIAYKFVKNIESKRKNNVIKIDGDQLNKLMELLNNERVIELSDSSMDKINSMIDKLKNHDEEDRETKDKFINVPKYIDDTGIIGNKDKFDEITRKLHNKNRAILIEGVPGTGKSKLILKYLQNMGLKENENYMFISFHPNFSYSNFIDGIRPTKNNGWTYYQGLFLEACIKAAEIYPNNYYFVIDELTRGNTEAIFGELMTGLCFRNKRLISSNGYEFCVPDNLLIIATRNVLDESAKQLDLATYQRFDKIRIEPQWTSEYVDFIVNQADYSERSKIKELLNTVTECMNIINECIKKSRLGRDRIIGTRDITIGNYTYDTLVEAIRDNLINTIDETIRYSKSDTEDAHDSRDRLYELVNGDR